MAEADKQGKKVGGAYIEITADSGPAEKAAATFFNWFAKTGEAATELAGKVSDTIEKTKELGEKGASSVKKVTIEFQTMTQGIKNANSTISADSKKNFDQMKKDAKLSYSEMTKDSKAMNRALVISMQDSVSNLKSSFTDLKNGFKTVGSAILDMFKQPVKVIKSVPSTVQAAMKSVSGFVASGFAQAKNQAISHLQQIPVKATQAINRTKDVFVTGFNSVVNTAASAVSKVGNSLSQLPSKTNKIATSLKNNFVNSIKDIPNKASNVWDAVKNGVRELPQTATNAASSIRDKVSQGFQSIKTKASSVFPSVKKDILAGIDEPASVSRLTLGKLVTALGLVQAASAAFGVLKNAFSGAIARYDTLQQFPKMMEKLGYSTESVTEATNRLKNGIRGLPTKLDEVVSTAQRLTFLNKDIERSSKLTIALNNAFLSSGASSEAASRGLDQFVQMLSVGEVDLEAWKTLQETMGYGLDKVAQSFGFAGQSAQRDLYGALKEGTITFDQFQDRLMELNEGVDGFAAVAKESGAGIGVAVGNMTYAFTSGFEKILTKIRETLQEKGLETIEQRIGNMQVKIEDAFSSIVEKVPELIDKFVEITDVLKKISPLLVTVVAGIVAFAIVNSIVGKLSLFIQTLSGLTAAFKMITSARKAGLATEKAAIIVENASIAVKKRSIATQKAFNAVLALNPITIFISAIVALGVAIYQLYKHSENFRDFIDGLRESFKQGLNGKYFSSDMNILEKGLYKLGESMKKVKLIAENLFSIFSGKSDYFQLSQLRDTGALTDSTVDGLAKILYFTNQVKAGFQAFFSVMRGESSSLDEVNNKFKSFISEDKLSVIYKLAEAVKAALGSIKEQFGQLKNAIFSAFQGDFGPLLGFIQQLLPKIIAILVGGIPGLIITGSRLISKLAEGMGMTIPELVQKSIEIVTSILVGVAKIIPQLVETGVSLINMIIEAMVVALPLIIDTGIRILMALIEGVSSVLPSLIDTAVQLFTTLVTAFIRMLPMIIDSGIKIIMALVQGILSVLPQLIATALKLVIAIGGAIIQNLPQILKAGVEILLTIGKGIISAIGQLIEMLPEVFNSIKEAFLNVDWLQLGKDVLDAIGKGFQAGIDKIKNFFSEPIRKIADGFKESADGIKQGSKGLFDEALDSAKHGAEGAKNAWSDVKIWFSDLWTSIKDNAVQSWALFKDVLLPYIKPYIDGVIKAFTIMKDYLSETWHNLINIATNTFDLLKNVILAPILFVTSLISGGWDEAKNNMIAVWENIKVAASNIWESIKEIFVGYFTSIFTASAALWDGFKQTILGLWNEIVFQAKLIWIEIKYFFINLWVEIKYFFVNTWNNIKFTAIEIWIAIKYSIIQTWIDIKYGAIELWHAIINFFVTTWENLKIGFFNTWESIKQGIINAWNAIKQFFWDTVNNIVTTAQTAWDNLKQGVSNAIQAVKNTFEKLKEIDLVEIGKNIVDGLIKGIKKKIKGVKDSVKEIAGSITDTLKDILDIHSPSRAMEKIARWVPEGVAVGIERSLPVVDKAVSLMAETMMSAVQDAEPAGLTSNMIITESYGMPNATDMQASAVQASQASNKGMAETTPALLQTASTAAAGIISQFDATGPQMLTEGAQWLTNFMTGWESIVPTMLTSLNNFITTYTSTIVAQNNPNYQMGRTWMQNKMDGWNSLVSTFITTVKNFCTQVLNLLRSYYTAMNQTGRAWVQNLLNGWNSLYQSFINRVNQLGNDAVNNLRSKNGGFYSAGQYLIQSLINGINSLGSSLDSTMRGLANKMVSGIGKGVNGVIGGVNYVLKEVESDKKLNPWAPPSYAKGTDGHPSDGLALVNDQRGTKYRELIQNPDGSVFIPKARNALVWLKKGAKVLNANMTDRVLKAQQTLSNFSNIPRYEDGVGDFDFTELLDGPDALVKLINERTSFDGINEPWLNMSKSAVKLMTSKAYDMVKRELDKFYTHGSFDGAMNANNVYQYLVDVAQRVMAKFPGLTVTSGYRPGDPYYHGKHQALDIAFPGVVGSSKYTEAANYAFEKFPRQIAYVITNGMVRDRMGLSGTGSSGQWVRWPDNDHFDHIHLNGSMGSGDIFSASGSGSAAGYNPSAGVEQWRSLAIKALKMEGQYSQANLNAMLRQIQTESGGNPNAINNWDINAQRGDPSRGLLQTISTTFRAYARPGYDKNIVDPLSNMLASIRYAVSRYGSLTAAYRGVGYKNGGWITQDGLYRAGENGDPEVVVPVSKPRRAMELIGQAISYMMNNGSNILDSASIGLNNLASNMTLSLMDVAGFDTQSLRGSLGYASASSLDFSELIKLMQVNNQLLTEIRDSDRSVYLDSEEIGKKTAKTVAKEIVRRKY